MTGQLYAKSCNTVSGPKAGAAPFELFRRAPVDRSGPRSLTEIIKTGAVTQHEGADAHAMRWIDVLHRDANICQGTWSRVV